MISAYSSTLRVNTHRVEKTAPTSGLFSSSLAPNIGNYFRRYFVKKLSWNAFTWSSSSQETAVLPSTIRLEEQDPEIVRENHHLPQGHRQKKEIGEASFRQNKTRPLLLRVREGSMPERSTKRLLALARVRTPRERDV